MERKELMDLTSCLIGSPMGNIRVQFSERGLRSVSLIQTENLDDDYSGLYDDRCTDRLAAVKTYINDIFFCRDPGRSGIELDMEGLSSFRIAVYKELMKVPFGEVITYGELARRIGRPGGARAVGQAMNRNPFLIIVPCHRVVASGGKDHLSLGGFGAGLDVKRMLLRLEGHSKEEISDL